MDSLARLLGEEDLVFLFVSFVAVEVADIIFPPANTINVWNELSTLSHIDLTITMCIHDYQRMKLLQRMHLVTLRDVMWLPSSQQKSPLQWRKVTMRR